MKLLLLLLAPLMTLAAEPDRLPRARWLENGLIDAGGNHEPYLFIVRRGGQRLDALEQVRRARSEDVIRGLKEQGVEVFHTYLYKGFGMAAEKPEMEESRRAAEIARRHGLKVDTYIQWNTMMYETFFAEEPRAQNWIQRDVSGLPILLTYGFQQSYRYRPCFSNQEYLDYLKRIVRYAVEEVKTDFIHFDNFDLNAEPESCHCQACVRGFREFLRRKYTPAGRKERFGFENVDYVNPPQWNLSNQPARMRIIYDPAIQEWIDYRCQHMADALRQMALYARSMNPEVAIEINPHGITGGNRAWVAGLDHQRLLKWTDVFWTEEGNLPGYMPDGRLVSKIRSFKLARAFDNILLTYISGSPLAMAEALTFNQTIGFAGSYPLGQEMLRYLGFYRKHRDLYVKSRDAGTVALLRSYPSITYNHPRAQLSAILMEQTLIQSRIPFDLVFDEQLAGLSKYRVLILPDSECLTDSQLAAIRRFVESGGGLVATGQAGMYDQWRRLRRQPGLAGLIEQKAPARAYEERPERDEEGAGAGVRKQVGRGRTVAIPRVHPDGPYPEEPYFEVRNRHWKLPRNAQDIVDGVRWAAGAEMPVEISGPPYLVAHLASQQDNRRWVLHLVNYNAARGGMEPVAVRCNLPEGASFREARLFSPEIESPETLKAERSGRSISFTVPKFAVYRVVAIEW